MLAVGTPAKETEMTDHERTGLPAVEGAGDLLGYPDRDAEDPAEHERDDERTVGGGVMSSGGTAVDRGTGTLDGQAQGPAADDDQGGLEDEPDDIQPSPSNHA
jgi:hypothetical protein